MAANIVALVDDLFFLAKIQETARSAGVSLAKVDLRRGVEAIAEAQPQLVLVDLGSRALQPLEWIKNLKADPVAKSIRVIGFVSHVEERLIADAKAAGCDSVMARSAFSQQLPNLLKSLVAETTG